MKIQGYETDISIPPFKYEFENLVELQGYETKALGEDIETGFRTL